MPCKSVLDIVWTNRRTTDDSLARLVVLVDSTTLGNAGSPRALATNLTTGTESMLDTIGQARPLSAWPSISAQPG